VLSDLADTEVTEGSVLELTARTSDSFPLPATEWFKEDTRLEANERVSMQTTNSEYRLVVSQVSQADQGRYTFKCANELGACQTSCNALVYG